MFEAGGGDGSLQVDDGKRGPWCVAGHGLFAPKTKDDADSGKSAILERNVSDLRVSAQGGLWAVFIPAPIGT
jgi:hypothetical protein